MKHVLDEGIKNHQKYTNKPEVDKPYITQAIEFVLEKMDENLKTFTEAFPGPVSFNNV